MDMLPSDRYTDLTSEVPGEEETEFDNQSWTDREVVEQGVEQKPADTTQQHDNQTFAQKRARFEAHQKPDLIARELQRRTTENMAKRRERERREEQQALRDRRVEQEVERAEQERGVHSAKRSRSPFSKSPHEHLVQDAISLFPNLSHLTYGFNET